jgi:hypothetical protein
MKVKVDMLERREKNKRRYTSGPAVGNRDVCWSIEEFGVIVG